MLTKWRSFRIVVGTFRSAFVTHCCGAGGSVSLPSFGRGPAGGRSTHDEDHFTGGKCGKCTEARTEIVIKEEK